MRTPLLLLGALGAGAFVLTSLLVVVLGGAAGFFVLVPLMIGGLPLVLFTASGLLSREGFIAPRKLALALDVQLVAWILLLIQLVCVLVVSFAAAIAILVLGF